MVRALLSMVFVGGLCHAQSPSPMPIPVRTEEPPAVRVSFDETLVRFNPQEVQLTCRDRRWTLTANGVVLKDFGAAERDAREALRIVRDYNLDALGSIAGAQPPFEYWLSQGRAPSSGFRGTGVSFRREKVRAEKVSGVWCVRDDRELLWNFNSDDLGAKNAAEVIRVYAFDVVGTIGNPPKMIWMVQDPQREEHLKMLPPSGFDRSVKMLMQNQLVIPKPVEPLKAVGDRLSPRTRPEDLSQSLVVGSKYPIDPRRIESRREKDGWRVTAGDEVLATFPHDDGSARQLTLWLTDRRVGEVARVGRGGIPIFFSGGVPLRANSLNLPTQRFKLDELRIVRREGTWILCDPRRTLLEFGEHEDDAAMMLATIRHLNLTTLIRFGHPQVGGLSVLARD